ncbi:MAG TPA: haloalkane dehalogenase [Microscillaceae bacterium]|nr:haloalkane dehalogenase [Microscillaceae bacterium]
MKKSVFLVGLLLSVTISAFSQKNKISPKSKYANQYKFIEVRGSKMAYIDEGAGDPILFLHGQPTSSYLWRNIMPHLEKQGRVIAPDLIGFGKSDQPNIDYTFVSHYPYVEGFIKKLGLKNITLVLHDWGSGLGLHYARLNAENIKAIVTMESIIAPVIPAKSYSDMRDDLGKFFTMAQGPKAKKIIQEDNAWLKTGGFLDAFILRPLDAEALSVYQAPHKTVKSRKQVYQWPKEMPIGKKPKVVYDIVTAYNQWLEETEVPWLFFYATPGVLNPPAAADYWAARAKNIETVFIGGGLHYVQEDEPYAIGRAITDFYRRINKKTKKLSAGRK